MKKHIVGAMGAVALIVALAGCAPSDAASPTEDPVVFSGSVPIHYTDAKQLASDAAALVYGTVVSSSEEKLSDLVVTRYDFRIDRTLGGDLNGIVGVYQTGTAEWILDMPLPQHLKVGESFLLFLTPLGVREGSTGSDGFAIVGPGAWFDNNGSFEVFGNPDSDIDYGGIPLKVGLDEAPTLLETSSLGVNR